jgi:hypothetical protein
MDTRRVVSAVVLAACLGAAAARAREPAAPPPDPAAPEPPPAAADESAATAAPPWQTVWGVGGLQVIFAGPKVAPNGGEYHPNFSLDLDFNCWVWRSQRLYLFGDARFWGQRSEDGVTNGRDGFVGTSKREFDLTGGGAWNYADAWEARAFGYSLSNLNRGDSAVTPSGFNDGFGLENRYYLSAEYAALGQAGYDVARADFVSVGYYPSKDMVGNDGQTFNPGLFLRAYVTCDLWKLPAYAFADATFLTERSLEPKLLLFDVGLAARPIPCCRQCEFRLGVESTADLQVGNCFNLWYASVRYVF